MRLGLRGRGLRFGLLGPLVGSVMLTLFIGSAAAATTTTFTYTGAEQTYSVPAGATAVVITAVGAPGSTAPGYEGTPNNGGKGASVTATVPVPAGTTTLYVEVGGNGIGSSLGCDGGGRRAFNGGSASSCAGGGGGASDVRTASIGTVPNSGLTAANDSRLVVAGGGGGGGGDYGCGPVGGTAGDQTASGAGNGGVGTYDFVCPSTSTPGGNGGFGGTQGGTGGAGTSGFPVTEDNGLNGSRGVGGDAPAVYDSGGGGGGNGFYGAGGGAGSSYWISSATTTSMSEDTTGTATVSITPVFPSVTPASVCNQTLQYADGSAKYLALTQKQKTAFDKTITALCAADLNPIKPGINPTKKKALIAAYKVGVNLLATGGWLTQSPQATQLATLADQL